VTVDPATTIAGNKHAAGDAATQQALADATSSYNSLRNQPASGVLPSSALAGQTITPGLYHSAAAYSASGAVTFDAQNDPSSYFYLVSDAATNMAGNGSVVLLNGAQANHVVWVIAGAMTVAAGAQIAGTVLSNAAITLYSGATLCGQAISLSAAVTLDSNVLCRLVSTAPSIAAAPVFASPFIAITTALLVLASTGFLLLRRRNAVLST